MDYRSPEQFNNVTATCKANVYSTAGGQPHHHLCDGSRKTLGLIYPGSYGSTPAWPSAWRSSRCLPGAGPGQGDWIGFAGGTRFDVPANSFFEIEVSEGLRSRLFLFVEDRRRAPVFRAGPFQFMNLTTYI